MYKYKPRNINDSVQFIANHIKYSNIPIEFNKTDRDIVIKDCLEEYHSIEDEVRKKELRDCILMNLWYLFPYILSSYKLKGSVFDDTLQLMILTAMKAIENFKPELGYKFSSYISGYLKDAISTSLKSNMLIKCPVGVAKTQEILRLKSEEVFENMKRNYSELTIDEDITLTEVSKDIVNKNKPSSLVHKTAEENIIENEQSTLLREAIGKPGLLTRKERIVLIYRFGLSGVPRLTLSEVAAIFRSEGSRASKVWVFQIEQKAKAKIKRYFQRNNLI